MSSASTTSNDNNDERSGSPIGRPAEHSRLQMVGWLGFSYATTPLALSSVVATLQDRHSTATSKVFRQNVTESLISSIDITIERNNETCACRRSSGQYSWTMDEPLDLIRLSIDERIYVKCRGDRGTFTKQHLSLGSENHSNDLYPSCCRLPVPGLGPSWCFIMEQNSRANCT
jgi:hypothetical protein